MPRLLDPGPGPVYHQGANFFDHVLGQAGPPARLGVQKADVGVQPHAIDGVLGGATQQCVAQAEQHVDGVGGRAAHSFFEGPGVGEETPEDANEYCVMRNA